MLQIDHIYEFLYANIFKDFDFYHCKGGVVSTDQISYKDITLFTQDPITTKKIFFYDQEPFISDISARYMDIFNWQSKYSIEENINLAKTDRMPYGHLSPIEIEILSEDHWYRGHYALNYDKSVVKPYNYDFISMNRIINNDRSYRIYWISKLKELGLLDRGLVSFNVTDNLFDDWRDETADPYSKLSDKARLHAEQHLVDIDKLVIDQPELPGSASADIPRGNDAFWHIVTETVFYYNKLHLTEKIFKPIVSKQPFMLLAAPGNLAYLKSYGFKTFDTLIDESYDNIQDPDLRIEAIVKQLSWYCNLTDSEKTNVVRAVEPIVLHNFHHFYNEFRHIITQELITNIKTLFQSIGYDDSHINYNNIYHTLTH